MEKLILTLGIIFVSLTAGYAFRHHVASGRSRYSEDDMMRLRKRLQIAAIFYFMPISAMLSLWGLPSPDTRLLALPLLGVIAFIVGGGVSIPIAHALGLTRPQTGSFYCCATFTNIGAVGSLVSVVFLGESTIALAALYRLCEEMFYYGISYPIAQWYGEASAGQKFSIRNLRLDPLLGIVLVALGLGITLNICDIPRPDACRVAATGFMLLCTTLLLFTIGLGLRLSRLSGYVREGVAVSLVKFVCVPVVVVSLAYAMGFGDIDNGVPLKTIAILACMPVAMNALVPPSLFNLDLDLANACWIYSTLGLFVVLPVLLVLLPFL